MPYIVSLSEVSCSTSREPGSNRGSPNIERNGFAVRDWTIGRGNRGRDRHGLMDLRRASRSRDPGSGRSRQRVHHLLQNRGGAGQVVAVPGVYGRNRMHSGCQ